jgi:hypothetical protein
MAMSQVDRSAGRHCIPRPQTVTAEYLRDILEAYCTGTWNQNPHTVAAAWRRRDCALVVRLPDVPADFTVLVDNGVVRSVVAGLPPRPRISCVVLSDTLQRLYYQETAAAIECIAGRITVRGNEVERRRLLAAMSFLTW